MWLLLALFLLLPGSYTGQGLLFLKAFCLEVAAGATGCSTSQNEVTGPKTQSGPEQGSLTVQCNYASSWRTYKKYWCRGADRSHYKILVITTGSEQEVKEDRFSIRDDQEKLMFTVTMQNLRRDDADTYWCGIERVGSDPVFPVKVTIDPVAGNSATVRTTTMESLAFVPPAMEKTTSNPPVTQTTSPLPWSLLSNPYFLLLVFLEVPLLLSMLSAVLWVNRPLRGPGRKQSQPDGNQ